MAVEANVNATNVSTGKPKTTGAVFVAPTTATLPTDATSTLGAEFKSLGYISEDGITNDMSSTSEDIRDWSRKVVASIQTETNDSWSMSFIESLNVEVLKLVYGDANVTESDGKITVKANGAEAVEKAFVIDMILNGGKVKRIVLPKGKLSELGEISYSAGGVIAYDATIAALPDGQNNAHYEYIE